VYLAARTLFCVIQSLSLEACHRLARAGAILLHDMVQVRRDVVTQNLRRAFPDMSQPARDRVARAMFEHFLLMLCEIAHAPRKIHQTNWRDHIKFVRPRELVRAFLESRALVAVTAHHGNFEMNGYVSGLLGFPTYTLARTLDNPYLHQFLSRFRASTGQYILPTSNSAEMAQQVVETGEALAALGDHYGGPKGSWIQFFNQPASCHKAIALFSLANAVPLAVVYTKRTDGPLRFETEFVSLIDPSATPDGPHTVGTLTQWYSDKIEQFVRQTPEQYWWLHRRWKDTRGQHRASRKRRRDAAGQPTGPSNRSASGAASRQQHD